MAGQLRIALCETAPSSCGMRRDAHPLAKDRVKAKLSRLDRMEAKLSVTIGDRRFEAWKEQ